MMCGFDAECVANVRFFLIVATIVTHLRQNHTPFFTVCTQRKVWWCVHGWFPRSCVVAIDTSDDSEVTSEDPGSEVKSKVIKRRKEQSKQ